MELSYLIDLLTFFITFNLFFNEGGYVHAALFLDVALLPYEAVDIIIVERKVIIVVLLAFHFSKFDSYFLKIIN